MTFFIKAGLNCSVREGFPYLSIGCIIYLPTNLADLNGTFWDLCRMIQAPPLTVHGQDWQLRHRDPTAERQSYTATWRRWQ